MRWRVGERMTLTSHKAKIYIFLECTDRFDVKHQNHCK